MLASPKNSGFKKLKIRDLPFGLAQSAATRPLLGRGRCDAATVVMAPEKQTAACLKRDVWEPGLIGQVGALVTLCLYINLVSCCLI